ncbi:hypothetical protein A2U01_0119559, partial [Trifolium medium]|nr:hypothetical protein [Trifolium medium]
ETCGDVNGMYLNGEGRGGDDDDDGCKSVI